MNKVLVLLFFAWAAFAGSPAQSFETLLDAVYTADSEALYRCLSPESVGFLNMMMLMMRAKPAEAAGEISARLGIEVSAEEIQGWTLTDLMDAVLSSPGFTGQLPPRAHISINGYEVNDSVGVVQITVQNVPGSFEIPMVLVDGDWKLDQSVIQAEL